MIQGYSQREDIYNFEIEIYESQPIVNCWNSEQHKKWDIVTKNKMVKPAIEDEMICSVSIKYIN